MKQWYCGHIAWCRGLVHFVYFAEPWGQKKILREEESFSFLLSLQLEHVWLSFRQLATRTVSCIPVISGVFCLLVKLLMNSTVLMQCYSLSTAVGKSLCCVLFLSTCCVRSIPKFTMVSGKILSSIVGPDLVLISVWSHWCNHCASPWTCYSVKQQQ